MHSMTQQLADEAARIKDGIIELLDRSRLAPRLNDDLLVFLNPSGDHLWSRLDTVGSQIQNRVLELYRPYRDLVKVLIRSLPADAQNEFTEADELVTKHIEQLLPTWCTSVPDAKEKTLEAVDAIQALLQRLYSVEGETIIVPDTNALVLAPILNQWAFDWCERFTIVLPPTVLSELDEMKIAHKNHEVRAKAEKMIRQIKELGRRGDLRAGVPVVTGKITARSVALEHPHSRCSV